MPHHRFCNLPFIYIAVFAAGVSNAVAQQRPVPPAPASQPKPAGAKISEKAGSAGTGLTKTPSGAELAARVRLIFADKCLPCHSSRSRSPRGDFGYVLDLPRVAAEPKYVVRSKPDDSYLWKLVRDDKMPPPDDPPLTKDEKELVRAWIAEGSPAPPPADLLALEPVSGGSQKSLVADIPFWTHLFLWLGRFHIAMIHFPIALVLAAAAADLWFWWIGTKCIHPAVRFCILLAAPVTAVAAALGWLLAWGGFGSAMPLTLFFHELFGTLAALWLVVVAIGSEVDVRRGTRSWLARLSLLAGAVVIGFAGHLGGTLVHGEAFYNW
jgi:hypothetical protein